jgi:hypothetical protein
LFLPNKAENEIDGRVEDFLTWFMKFHSAVPARLIEASFGKKPTSGLAFSFSKSPFVGFPSSLDKSCAAEEIQSHGSGMPTGVGRILRFPVRKAEWMFIEKILNKQ